MSAVAISADGKRYVTARDGGPLRVWDAATGAQVNPLPSHRDAIGGVSASPDSRLVATFGYDDTLRVWEAASGKQLWTAEIRAVARRRNVTFTPDGRGIIYDAVPDLLAMADATTGKPLDLPFDIRGVPTALGGFSADGKTLVTFSGDKTRLWDWPAGTPRQTFRVAFEKPGPREEYRMVPVVTRATLSPDGQVLISSHQYSVFRNGSTSALGTV